MVNNKNFKKDLEIIFNKTGEIVNSLKEDDVNDLYTFYLIMYGDYNDEVYEYFWSYFREKYNLPEIKEYFSDFYILFNTVFNHCVKPYNLRIDNLKFKKKNHLTCLFHKIIWNIMRWFLNNWIVIISTILMTFSFLFAFSLDCKETFLYDVSINVGMSFLIAIIISSINSSHNNRIRVRKKEVNIISKEFENLRYVYDKTRDLMKNKNYDILEFSKEFIILNNSLKRFLEQTRNIIFTRSIEEFYKLVDFEKEVFEYSSSLVRKPFNKHQLDSITKEELGQLQIYVIKLGELISRLEFELSIIKSSYIKEIHKMEDKSL